MYNIHMVFRSDDTNALADDDAQKSRRAVRPDFGSNRPNIMRGNFDNSKRNDKATDVNAARARLRGPEWAAAQNTPRGSKDLNEAKEAEESPRQSFMTNVKGLKSSNKKGGFKGWLKKGGPVTGIIIATLMGTGGAMFGAQPFQLLAWKENVSLLRGQNSAIMARRSNFVMRRMLSSHRNITKTNIFGKEKYKLGKKTIAKLRENNIEVETEGTKHLVYTDPKTGKKIPIVASEADVPKVEGSVTLDAIKTDPAFKKIAVAVDTATLTFTGKVAGWFDDLANLFLRRVGGDDARNKWEDVGKKPSEEEVDNKLFKNAVDGVEDTRAPKMQAEDENDLDKDGKPKIKDVEYESDAMKIKDANVDVNVVKAKLSAKAKKVLGMGNVACMVLRAIGVINAMIAGIQVYNTVSYSLALLEAIDQTKSGDGTDAINKIANRMNKSTTGIAYTEEGGEKGEKVEGAVTESKGFNNAFSDKNLVSEHDPEAFMVNRENANKIALRSRGMSGGWASLGSDFLNFGSSIAAFTICNGIQIALGAMDAATDYAPVVAFVSSVVTGGLGAAIGAAFLGIKAGIKAIVKAVAVSAAMTVVGVFIALVAPIAANWLAGNLKNMLLGKIGGAALDSGTHNIFNGNLQMTAGMNANKEQVMQLHAMTKEVEKDWIAYDRATLSPFDISSPYTFMGSLMRSAVPVFNMAKGGSALNFASSSMGLVGNSLASLSGIVSAADQENSFKLSMSSDENCAQLSSMGVAGDAYCNKYNGAYIDDLNSMDSAEIFDKIADNFEGEDESGNPKIKPDSDYAKYIVACNLNDAQPGSMSAVVETYIQKTTNQITGGSPVAGGLLGFVTNFVPFEGGLDAMDAAREMVLMKWNSQAVCSDPNYRYFSDYAADQRVLAEMGVIEESSIAAFIKDYYKENPLDNSREGIIARMSGLTVEQVEDTLALIEAANYVANYNSEERYQFDAQPKGVPIHVSTTMIAKLDMDAIMRDEVVYADTRNRFVMMA